MKYPRTFILSLMLISPLLTQCQERREGGIVDNGNAKKPAPPSSDPKPIPSTQKWKVLDLYQVAASSSASVTREGSTDILKDGETTVRFSITTQPCDGTKSTTVVEWVITDCSATKSIVKANEVLIQADYQEKTATVSALLESMSLY